MTNATGLVAQASMALDQAERHGQAATASLLVRITAMIAAMERGERVAAATASLAPVAALPGVNDNLGL